MRKTAESKLLQELVFDTDSTSIIHTVPSETSYIIDLMVIAHKASSHNAKTFEDLANNLSEQHIDEAYKYADHVIIVPDRYDIINSIKSFERPHRSNETYTERIISTGMQPLPSNIHRFLSNGKNKTHLVNFLLKHWSEIYQNKLNQQQTLTLALLNGTTLLVKRESAVTTEVITDHEEADSKMFVYAYDLMTRFMVYI